MATLLKESKDDSVSFVVFVFSNYLKKCCNDICMTNAK